MTKPCPYGHVNILIGTKWDISGHRRERLPKLVRRGRLPYAANFYCKRICVLYNGNRTGCFSGHFRVMCTEMCTMIMEAA